MTSVAVEYHHHGGECWLRRHVYKLSMGYPLASGPRGSQWWLSRVDFAPLPDEWLFAYAYGKFRFYADVIAERRTILYDPTGELLCKVFDGVRLVELPSECEIVRYVRST